MAEELTFPIWYQPWWLDEAFNEAQKGLDEGGIPIGSVLIDPRHHDGER